MRDFLRGLPVFAGDLPVFDTDKAPERPDELFAAWLAEAVDAGVREPHAMTLSTVGADGIPAARVLILKNVDEHGWQFAAHADSPKGQDLARHPAAALTFYWPARGRQIRVRGPVRPEPADRSAADFLARPPGSRAEASIGRQSRVLPDRRTLDAAVEPARR
ncbi:pyridoxine/pyridoxamine 5'-phosphate oxidase [Paractinoplanes lichenicola]|uniref:Pyridoxamine 5'-phosphate oxidase family protein n=1 Tax=Paractinoplanes lichenicola TaxID=2802976 RepID=A0ABS1W053_9ACTN|nr:pyridoxamine 5'-phosphate oxidase family protein [Actinoplanes lichenicola]MBL7260114.1 pyridoxamine 5'-phosphate oxidase family protein [Actinoplanes lichenicola]